MHLKFAGEIEMSGPCQDCPLVQFIRTDPAAVTPTRGSELAIGYDLTAIKVYKVVDEKTTLYDTGLSVLPPNGYYIEIVARSSIIKTGYVLANSVGIIDPDYRGNLLIALTKVNPAAPDLTLPFTRCQVVLRKAEWFNVEVTDSAPPATARGAGGFGSTDAKK